MSDINSFNNPPELQEENSPKPKKNVRKRKTIISMIVVLFLVTGIAGLGFARGFYDNHRGEGHGPMGFIMDKLVKDLDLNDQQKSEVEKIKAEIKDKMESKKDERKDDAEQMEKLFRQDTFDKTKALELAKQHDAEREEMKSFMIDELAKFHSILTNEQRNKAADKMKEFREKKHEMMDKWKKDDKKN